MKKIMPLAASIMLILVASLFATVGTMALFSDTETSASNNLTAGTLDLQVDDQDDPNVAHMTVEDMKPGDTIHQYYTLTNVGSVCGQVSIEFANQVNYENGQTEPEAAVDATGGDPGEGNGELGGRLYVLVKWSDDAGTTWHEILMVPNGHTFINNLVGPYGLGENGADPIPTLCNGDAIEIELRLWWNNQNSDDFDNAAQSDSVTFDVIFNLDQA
jgi:predicted ribosomally synthesized peptide with SipW-like signal peptide